MIALQFSRTSPPTKPLFSRSANTATAALPLIPRRAASVSRSRSAPSSPQSITLVSTPPPVKVVIQPSTPPPQENNKLLPRLLSPTSDSGSSCASDIKRPAVSTRSGGSRAVSSTVCPPEQSTPTPAVYNARIAHGREVDDSTPRPLSRPLLYTPGIPLRVQTEGLKARTMSESHVRTSSGSSVSAIVNAMPSSQPPLIRKKSGQLVKSSLKTSKSLSVITSGLPSKSEPATPTHAKVVHFDAQLEHVKLFLAEQKPLAVSRDGSPTEDTSGTDSDFPSFIFGDSGDAKPKKTLVMKLLNMPQEVNVLRDVCLEELILAHGTNILGQVRVRNISYAKWVTVRFTFDSWQTTSEVTGKWIESINRDFDRFSFNIRLNDLLARIEGKRLYLAIRYSVAGREFWDNNSGQNYVASFTRATTPAPSKTNKDDGGCVTNGDFARLKSKLEIVADRKQSSGQPLLGQSLGRASGQALRSNFKVSVVDDSSSSPPRLRAQTYPATPIPNSIPWPPRGKMQVVPAIATSPRLRSPRDADEEVLFSAACLLANCEDVDSDDSSAVSIHRPRHFGGGRPLDSGVHGTTLVSPRREFTPHAPPRFHSFPPLEDSLRNPHPHPPYGLGIDPSVYLNSDSGSELSTPGFSSPSSSSSPSTDSSPAGSFYVPAGLEKAAAVSPGTNYRQFLNKFCFFTGSDMQPRLVEPEDSIPRAHSASDIEEFLSATSVKPPLLDSFYPSTPSRSPSFDELLEARSGSATPTAHTIHSTSHAAGS